MAKKIVSKPGFAVGFSVSIVALLVALLVPITFESSVGYTLVYEDVASSNALQKDELVESMKSVGLGSANVYQSNRDSLIYLNIAGLRSESQMKVAQALIEAMTDKAGNMVASRVQQRVEGSLYARAVGEAEQTVELQSWIDGQTNEEVKLGVEKSLQMAGIKDYKVTVTSSDDEKTRTVKLVIPQKLTTEQTIKILGNEIKLGGPYEDIALSLPDIKNMSDEEIRIYLRAKLDSIGKKDADIKVDSTDDGLIEIRIKPDSN